MKIHAQDSMDSRSRRGGVVLVGKHTVRICLVGDYDPKITAHQAIPKALALAAKGNPVEPAWLGTERARDADLDSYSGFLFASPARRETLSLELAADASTPLWSLRGTSCT